METQNSKGNAVAQAKMSKATLYAGEVELAQTVLTHLLWDLALL